MEKRTAALVAAMSGDNTDICLSIFPILNFYKIKRLIPSKVTF